ncbi:hypothetical protein AC786_06755 [Helicobacter pylori]|uniref:hypothetical protein n=1 Tax=Helicobacter pylori TaxID=210 RepID=UPI0006800882|nr:hypothetical protein [Helicobacter pylori]KMZ49663.1 hypothetical protein AC786_06755 [Helicobacter pylori]
MKFFLLKKFSEFLNAQTHFNLKRLSASGFLLETFSKEKHAFNNEERVLEIARMIGGSENIESAISFAKEKLKAQE